MKIGDFTVRGTDMQVNGGFDYANDSLSGESSGTETVNKGIKPKSFTVSLRIAYENPNDLTALVRVAESLDAAGSQTVYDIVDSTINAFNVRRVRFDRNFRASENGADGLQVWDVSFSVTEVGSTSEKVETRIAVAESTATASAGAPLPFNIESGLSSDYEAILQYSNNAFSAS